MKISIDDDDRIYQGSGVKVFLDGVELESCISADEEKGVAFCHVKDLEGNYVLAESGD